MLAWVRQRKESRDKNFKPAAYSTFFCNISFYSTGAPV